MIEQFNKRIRSKDKPFLLLFAADPLMYENSNMERNVAKYFDHSTRLRQIKVTGNLQVRELYRITTTTSTDSY